MKITVFGASGVIGSLVVKLLLENGHTVTAYVRNPNKMKIQNKNLKILSGELNEHVKVEQAIAGADAVISTLGPALNAPRKSKETPIADGHQKIVTIMEKLNIKRFVTLATPTVHSDNDKKNIGTVMPAIMAKLFLPSAYIDIIKAGDIVKNSSLEWTVIRIINPNAKHKQDGYQVSLGDKAPKLSVLRENVALCFYDTIVKNLYVKQMPIVYNKGY